MHSGDALQGQLSSLALFPSSLWRCCDCLGVRSAEMYNRPVRRVGSGAYLPICKSASLQDTYCPRPWWGAAHARYTQWVYRVAHESCEPAPSSNAGLWPETQGQVSWLAVKLGASYDALSREELCSLELYPGMQGLLGHSAASNVRAEGLASAWCRCGHGTDAADDLMKVAGWGGAEILSSLLFRPLSAAALTS